MMFGLEVREVIIIVHLKLIKKSKIFGIFFDQMIDKHLRLMIIWSPDHPSVFDSVLVAHQERPRKSVQKY